MQRYTLADRGFGKMLHTSEDGPWAEYSEAQAENARLQAEVELWKSASIASNAKWVNSIWRESERNNQASEDYMILAKENESIKQELSAKLDAVLSLIADSDIPRAEAKKLAAAIRAMKTGDK